MFDEENNPFNSYILLTNYPNPFNSRTTIGYEILQSGYVELTLYDIRGREIMNLYDGYNNPGSFELTWNGTDQEGKEVSRGIYFLTLMVNNKNVKSMKMLLLK